MEERVVLYYKPLGWCNKVKQQQKSVPYEGNYLTSKIFPKQNETSLEKINIGRGIQAKGK